MTVRDAAEALLISTENLVAKLVEGEEALEPILGERNRAFKDLVALVGETPPESIHPILKKVAEIDSVLIPAIQEAQERIQAELTRISAARSVARKSLKDDAAPRFITHRV